MAQKKLWGGRFAEDQDPLFDVFNRSLPFDHELLEADIEGSLAYSRALEAAGILTRAERSKLERGLMAVLRAHKQKPEQIRQSRAEDVHSYVEQALAPRVGRLALKLHTGRSRNDQVATDLRMYLLRRAQSLEWDLNGLLVTLELLAQKFLTVILPGYTHLQPAQPILFSHFLLAYGEMFLRDRQRLREAEARMRVCPLGSGALAGTIYRIQREQLARDLGFLAAAENSMDAVSDRDFVLDFLFWASVTMTHLSRLAEDLIIYSSAEFGFLSLPDSLSTGSSLMPQKKNPDSLELIRGKCGRVTGHLVSLLTVLKGLPMTYNKDLQEDKEGLFDTDRTLSVCLRMMRQVLEGLTIHSQRMRRSASEGYMNATELADYLVARGVPFRRAHHIVGRIVRCAIERGCALEELPLDEYRRFSRLFEKDLYRALTPESAVAKKRQKGGTAASAVRSAIKSFRKRILRPSQGPGRARPA